MHGCVCMAVSSRAAKGEDDEGTQKLRIKMDRWVSRR